MYIVSLNALACISFTGMYWHKEKRNSNWISEQEETKNRAAEEENTDSAE